MKRAGVLASVFSLPGKYGIGDFGQAAYDFIDILAQCGMKIWQVLPLNPVGFGNSPYQAYSSFAGDINYIDLDALVRDGLLPREPKPFNQEKTSVDYTAVRLYKRGYLREAFRNFRPTPEYAEFVSQRWVFLYAVFRAFGQANQDRTWNEWPEEQKNWITDRELDLAPYRDTIDFEMFCQYEFYIQWKRVKEYANAKGILIMGDIPFYVGLNSLDVWMNQDEFELDSKGYPLSVAGVPPDYFSADGQRWGNPIYLWKHMEKNHFAFWKNRVLYTAKLFDLIRIDHFRAFDTYWVIPASCPTAIDGEWKFAPGYDFFDELLPMLKGTEIVAEDLGEMRSEVYDLRDHYEFAGMNVLQFTFFDPKFKLRDHMISYTGTHDNDTITGWWEGLSDKEKISAADVLLGKKKSAYELAEEAAKAAAAAKAAEAAGIAEKTSEAETEAEEEDVPDKDTDAETADIRKEPEEPVFDPSVLEKPIHRYFLEFCMNFNTDTVILALQDILGLPSEARINTPSTVGSPDWEWKLNTLDDLKKEIPYLTALVKESGRA